MAKKKCNDISVLTERYKKRLEKNKPDYELIGEYNDKVVDIKHKKCGKIFSISPNYILYYSSCPICNKSNREKRLILNEEIKIREFKKYIETIVNNEYIVVGDKIDKKTRKINIKHNCGYEYGVRICMFKKGRRCPLCTKTKVKSPDVYKSEFEKVANKNFELLTEYKSSTEKIKIFHKKCNNEFEILPGHFIRDPRCSICEKKKALK